MQALNSHFESKGGKTLKRVKVDEIVLDKNGAAIGLKVREEYKFDKNLADDDAQNVSGDVKFYKAKNSQAADFRQIKPLKRRKIQDLP